MASGDLIDLSKDPKDEFLRSFFNGDFVEPSKKRLKYLRELLGYLPKGDTESLLPNEVAVVKLKEYASNCCVRKIYVKEEEKEEEEEEVRMGWVCFLHHPASESIFISPSG